MTSQLLQKNSLLQTTQSMTETMDAQDYSFFLAYGETQDDEQNYILPDVEMYSIICSDPARDVEASYRDFLSDYASEAQDTSSPS